MSAQMATSIFNYHPKMFLIAKWHTYVLSLLCKYTNVYLNVKYTAGVSWELLVLLSAELCVP